MAEQKNTSKIGEIVYKLKKRQRDFLKIFKNNMGLIHISCDKAKVPPSTYYFWMDNNPLFKQKVEEINKMIKDFGEGQLYQLVKEKNPQAVLHYNKTKNRDRGYGDVIETRHSGEISLLSKKERQEQIKKLLG